MIVITSWCIIIQRSLVFFNNVVKCAFWVLTTGNINLPYLMFNLIIIIKWNHCAQPKLHKLESGTNGYNQSLDFFFLYWQSNSRIYRSQMVRLHWFERDIAIDSWTPHSLLFCLICLWAICCLNPVKQNDCFRYLFKARSIKSNDKVSSELNDKTKNKE